MSKTFRLKVIMATLFLCFGLLLTIPCSGGDVNQYLDWYNKQLDTVIQQSKAESTLIAFVSKLTAEMNMLVPSWERDKDRLKEEAMQLGTNDPQAAVDEIEKAYHAWESEASQRVEAAKAEFVTKQIELTDEQKTALEGSRKNLETMLGEKYRELKVLIVEDTLAYEGKITLAEEYRHIGVQNLELAYEEINTALDTLFSDMKKQAESIAAGSTVQDAALDSALEKEKERLAREYKELIKGVYYSYQYRISRTLLESRESLLAKAQEERARQVAQEIKDKVSKKLAEDTNKKLEALLSQSIMSEQDVSRLSSDAAKLYEEGLELWAQAARDLITRQNEWYKNYDTVFSDGNNAWLAAIKELKALKDAWLREFDTQLSEGLKNWEDIFDQLKISRDDFQKNLRAYYNEKNADCNTFLQQITAVMGSGTQSVGEVEAYRQSYMDIINQELGVILPDNIDTYFGIDAYEQLVKYMEGKKDAFLCDPLLANPVWGLASHRRQKVSFFGHKEYEDATDSINTNTIKYYIFDKAYSSDGTSFIINIGVNASVTRYWVEWADWYASKVDGMQVFRNQTYDELVTYSIKYTYANNNWEMVIIPESIKKENSSIVTSANSIRLKTAKADNKGYIEQKSKRILSSNYFDRIRELTQLKDRMTQNILDIQGAMISFMEGAILDNPLLTEEGKLNEALKDKQLDTLLSDHEMELLKAGHEMTFWNNQKQIIDAVLKYALSEGGKETAKETAENYEEAKASYEAKLAEYNGELATLTGISEGIKQDAESLTALKADLEAKKKELEAVVKELLALKFASQLDQQYITTLSEQINMGANQYTALLEKVETMELTDRDAAMQPLLYQTYVMSYRQSNAVFEQYYDEQNKTSLISLEKNRTGVHTLLVMVQDAKKALDAVLTEYDAGQTSETALAAAKGAVDAAFDHCSELLASVTDKQYEAVKSELSSVQLLLQRYKEAFTASGQITPEQIRALPALYDNTYQSFLQADTLLNRMIEGKKKAYIVLAGLSAHEADLDDVVKDQQGKAFASLMSDTKRVIEEKSTNLDAVDKTVATVISGFNSMVRTLGAVEAITVDVDAENGQVISTAAYERLNSLLEAVTSTDADSTKSTDDLKAEAVKVLAALGIGEQSAIHFASLTTKDAVVTFLHGIMAASLWQTLCRLEATDAMTDANNNKVTTETVRKNFLKSTAVIKLFTAMGYSVSPQSEVTALFNEIRKLYSLMLVQIKETSAGQSPAPSNGVFSSIGEWKEQALADYTAEQNHQLVKTYITSGLAQLTSWMGQETLGSLDANDSVGFLTGRHETLADDAIGNDQAFWAAALQNKYIAGTVEGKTVTSYAELLKTIKDRGAYQAMLDVKAVVDYVLQQRQRVYDGTMDASGSDEYMVQELIRYGTSTGFKNIKKETEKHIQAAQSIYTDLTGDTVLAALKEQLLTLALDDDALRQGVPGTLDSVILTLFKNRDMLRSNPMTKAQYTMIEQSVSTYLALYIGLQHQRDLEGETDTAKRTMLFEGYINDYFEHFRESAAYASLSGDEQSRFDAFLADNRIIGDFKDFRIAQYQEMTNSVLSLVTMMRDYDIGTYGGLNGFIKTLIDNGHMKDMEALAALLGNTVVSEAALVQMRDYDKQLKKYRDSAEEWSTIEAALTDVIASAHVVNLASQEKTALIAALVSDYFMVPKRVNGVKVNTETGSLDFSEIEKSIADFLNNDAFVTDTGNGTAAVVNAAEIATILKTALYNIKLFTVRLYADNPVLSGQDTLAAKEITAYQSLMEYMKNYEEQTAVLENTVTLKGYLQRIRGLKEALADGINPGSSPMTEDDYKQLYGPLYGQLLALWQTDGGKEFTETMIDAAAGDRALSFARQLYIGDDAEALSEFLTEVCGFSDGETALLVRNNAAADTPASYAALVRNEMLSMPGVQASYAMIDMLLKAQNTLSERMEQQAFKYSMINAYANAHSSSDDVRSAYMYTLNQLIEGKNMSLEQARADAFEQLKLYETSEEDLLPFLSLLEVPVSADENGIIATEDIEAIVGTIWLDRKAAEYTYEKDNGIIGSGNEQYKRTIKTAVLFCSGNKTVNLFIEAQNKLLQQLFAFTGGLEQGITEFKDGTSDFDAGGISRYKQELDEITSTTVFDLKGTYGGTEAAPEDQREYDFGQLPQTDTTLDMEAMKRYAEVLQGFVFSGYSNQLALYGAESGLGKTGMISGFAMGDTAFLSLVSAAVEALKNKDEIAGTLLELEKQKSILLADIGKKGAEPSGYTGLYKTIWEKENAILDGKRTYNEQVDAVNIRMKEAEALYTSYLTAKEIYFYATNIYSPDKDNADAIDMYRSQKAEYESKLAKATAHYDLMKGILEGKKAESEAEQETIASATAVMEVLTWLKQTADTLLVTMDKSNETLTLAIKNRYAAELLGCSYTECDSKQKQHVDALTNYLNNKYLTSEKYANKPIQTMIDAMNAEIKKVFTAQYITIKVVTNYTYQSYEVVGHTSRGGGEGREDIWDWVTRNGSRMTYHSIANWDGTSTLAEFAEKNKRLEKKEKFVSVSANFKYVDIKTAKSDSYTEIVAFDEKAYTALKETNTTTLGTILGDLYAYNWNKYREEYIAEYNASNSSRSIDVGQVSIDTTTISEEQVKFLKYMLGKESGNDAVKVYTKMTDAIKTTQINNTEDEEKFLGQIYTFEQQLMEKKIVRNREVKEEAAAILALYAGEDFTNPALEKGVNLFSFLKTQLTQRNLVKETDWEKLQTMLVQFMSAHISPTEESDIFTAGNTSGAESPTLATMTAELKRWIQKKTSEAAALKEQLQIQYNGKRDDFQPKAAAYSYYKAEEQRNTAMLKSIELELALLDFKATTEQKTALERLRKKYGNNWQLCPAIEVSPELMRHVTLFKQREECSYLAAMFKLLTTGGTAQQYSKYGIKEYQVVKFDTLLAAGIDLAVNDFSERGMLAFAYKEKKIMYDALNLLGPIATMQGNTLFREMGELYKVIYGQITKDQTELASIKYQMKLDQINAEKDRFDKKVTIGKGRGIAEFDRAIRSMTRTYTYWLTQMKDTFDEGEEGWKQKEIEYVTSRDQWVTDVRNGKMEMIASDTKTMRDELAEFSASLNGKTKGFATTQKALMETFTPIVQIPQWMSDYEIMAETTFGALKKAVFSDDAIEQSIDSLEATVQEFEDKKMMLELDKLYHDLEVAKDQVMGKIEGISDGNQDMVENMMFSDGYSVRGGSYYKKALYKYSLLEGERFREIYLPYFKDYAVAQEFSSVFNLPDRETFLAGTDIDEKKIEVYRQIASMKTAAKAILGTKNKPGTLYTTNVGRMATGEEIQKYSEQRKKSEPKGWLESFIGALLSPLNFIMQGLTEVLKAVGSLFIPEDGEDPNAGLEEFQKALLRDIPDGKNRGLETGRIMLNYQYNDMLETQAIAARDGGFLNAPLFDGGPSLASVGNIALTIATAGTSLAANALAMTAVNMAYTFGTGLINYATASSDMRGQVADGLWKSLATQAVGFGIQQGMGEVKKLFTFAEDGTQNLLAGITSTVLDTSTELLTSIAGNTINSFDGNGFNQDRFNKGMKNVLLGSIGSLAKNTFKSINMLSTGAHWNGGLTYGVGKYTDEFVGVMTADTNFFGGLIEQAVNNITGVQQGFTFNILNTKDFGAKNGVGLLELTLGGDSATLRIGTGGLNASISGITDMLAADGQRDALKSAKQELQYAQNEYYDALESNDQTKIARAKLKLEQADTHMTVYMQNNMAYGQMKALEEKIAQETDPDKKKEYQQQLADAKANYAALNESLKSGNYSSIVQFAAQNQKVGSVAELDSDQIVDFSYDKDGNIVFNMNKMAVSTTKLFHELGGHDGQDSGNHDQEVAEDKRAHTFDTMLWDGLKQKYGVKDFEMDNKLAAYKSGSSIFNQFISSLYLLGQEKNELLNNGNSFIENLGRELNEIEQIFGADALHPQMKALLSVYKGFENEGKKALDLLPELYNKTNILDSSINNLNLMLQKGYELKKNEKGEIEASNISIVNDAGILRDLFNSQGSELQTIVKPLLDKLPDADVINIMTQFTKGTNQQEAAVIVQRYIYDHKTTQEIMKYREVGILTGTVAEMQTKVTNMRAAINEHTAKIREEAQNTLNVWREKIFIKLRDNPRLVTPPKEGNTKKTFPRDGIVKFNKKDDPERLPLCNIGTANYLAMLGYEEYLYNGPKYKDVQQAADPKKPKETATATQLINAIANDTQNFTGLNNLLDWDAFKTLCNGDSNMMFDTLQTIFKVFDTAGYGVIGTMLANSGSSHIFPYANGKSYDVNYSPGTQKTEPSYITVLGKRIKTGETTTYWEADYTAVDLWDSWGNNPARVLSRLMEYSSMDKETWIQNYMEANNKNESDANKFYNNYLYNHEYNFYITNYSFMSTMHLDDLWGTQSFDFWLKNNP